MMHNKYLYLALLLFAFAACDNLEQENNKMDNKEPIIKVSDMDTTVKSGDDFFVYANGGWMKANPIPEEYSRYGAFEVLDKMNKEKIKNLVLDLAANKEASKGSPAQQIRDFYLSGMDTAAINSKGIQPLNDILQDVDRLQNVKEIPALQARMNFMGMHPLFVLYAAQDEKHSERIIANFMQGGLTLPDRDYYISQDPRSQEIRKNYLDYIQKMLTLADWTPEEAARAAQHILQLETRLAQASMTRLERRDPNKTYNLMKVVELDAQTPGYSFADYFKALGIQQAELVNVHQPDFAKELSTMMKEVPLEQWKSYLKWNIINDNATLLSSDFEKTRFDFFGRQLSGTKKMEERWKKIISSLNANLGEAMGKMYVEKYFPKEAKDRMIELVSNLKLSLHESIENLDWMSEPTKEKALEKLDAINVKVGYPNKWKDYSTIDIVSDNFIQNVWNCSAFSYRDNLNKIGKPVDREEWGMTPQTVNAYYSPNMNEIVFPAAILQAPFFDMRADDGVNYGAIGVVIGHEMTHAFDDQGRQYDKEGNLNDWWTEEDARKFKEKTQILVEQYNNYVVLDSLKVNGELTLGENIADNGGLFIAHNALMKSYEKHGAPGKMEGFTSDQRFLLSYARVWRQNISPKALMRRLKEDVHSPGEARVNAGVANLPWWYEAFDVQPGDRLYIAPEKRAKIW